ncbi:MAG TPA: MBL fold metallo-hydrolase [Cyclobacteriaceae bacterium]
MKRREIIKLAATTTLASVPLMLKSESGVHQRLVSESEKTMKIQKLNWAGIKIELDETTLFVDATSYEGQKDMRLTAETKYRHAIITHHHPDHFDPAALITVFDKRSRLYCAEESLSFIDSRDLRVHGKKLHQPVDVSLWTGDLVAIPVPAVDGFGHPQVSWVIKGGGKTIIHCGDTLWHGYWRDIAIAYGPFDIAFLPINGARINSGKVIDTGIPAVLTPEQAVVAGQLLQAKRVCPIHYGRPGATYFEVPNPEQNFLKFAKERNVNALLLRDGEYVQE